MFSNPSLQTFYANLEALVYDEEAKEFEDLSMPNYVMQDPKIEPFVTQIKEEFGTVSLINSVFVNNYLLVSNKTFFSNLKTFRFEGTFWDF